MDFSGHTETASAGGPIPALPVTDSPASLNYKFPFEVSGGVSYRPTEKWNLEFDTEYTDWDELGNFTIHQSPNPLVPLANVPVAFDWESSWYFEWGATRYFENGWHVSAGYIFNENSIPDAHYTPLVADMDKHFFSLGTGYTGKHFNFDIAYQFGYGPDRTVVGSAAPLGYPAAYHPADGTYSFLSHAVLVSVGWRF
jgi:long-chain fatty acid transport protein